MEKEKSGLVKMAREYLFPNRCPVCLDIAVPRGRLICDACREKLPLIEGPTCKKCGKPLEQEEKEYCGDCVLHIRSFEQGIALMPYSDEVVHRLMMRVKYRNARQLLDYPCRIMGERYRDLVKRWGVEALIPVPLHGSKRRMRGFNQAEEIAQRLGEMWNLPVDTSLLYRKKKTVPQKELNPEKRFRNLKDAFAVREQEGESGYRTLMLVDDIYTTGSTVESCTRALLAGGAKRVFSAVLACGYDPY